MAEIAEPPKITINETELRKNVQRDEKARVKELQAIHRNFAKAGITEEMVSKAIDEDTTIPAFNDMVLRHLAKTALPTVDAGSQVERVAAPIRDIHSYSFCRAIRQTQAQMEGKGRLDGIEGEMSQEIAKRTGRDPKGFFMPDFAFAHPARILDLQRKVLLEQRDLSTLTQTGGAFTVESTVLGTELVELYRHRMYVMAAGARYLSGLQGNVLIPRQTGPATAYWLAENAAVTESDQQFGQFSLQPHTIMANTNFSKQLLAQSSIDVEGLVRNDLNVVISEALDWAALQGSGNSGQPIGIANAAGVGSVSFGGAATQAKVWSFETLISNQDADIADMCFITSPNTRGKWKLLPIGAVVSSGASFPMFVWQSTPTAGLVGGGSGKGTDQGMVNGYRAYATSQLGSGGFGPGGTVPDQVIFGNFHDLILANWAGIDVVTDPYTAAATGEIKITIHLMADVGIRHPISFAVSTDGGAQ